jgi:hypothetical protein
MHSDVLIVVGNWPKLVKEPPHTVLEQCKGWHARQRRRLRVGSFARSHLTRMLREAHAACGESIATGIPIDEVTDMRAARSAGQRAVAREVVEAYNDSVYRVLERGAREDHIEKAVAMENVKRLGRREFLSGAGKAAFVATLAATMGEALVHAQPASATQKVRVAVVGGGLAGLRCAHALWTKYGWSSTVYEANSTMGGRCETNRNYFLNGDIAEMHGEFISSEHLSVLNLVKGFNLTLEDYNAHPAGTVDTYWFNGARYTPGCAERGLAGMGMETVQRRGEGGTVASVLQHLQRAGEDLGQHERPAVDRPIR